jgi:hypothetical protein
VLITKRDKKIAGYLRRMNGLSRGLADRLEVLQVDEAEVCDQESGCARGERAYQTEMASLVPEFLRRKAPNKAKRASQSSAILPDRR